MTDDTEQSKEEGQEEIKRSGGPPFFISLLLLAILAPINISVACAATTRAALTNWLWFLPGLMVGAVIALGFIQGHLSVFLHELKHSIVSNLAGNKAKAMVVDRRSGHFEYSYTKKTAGYNAFIALAPYILPLFTFLAFIPALIFFWNRHHYAVFIVGIGVGIDCIINSRDISPWQSDIYGIRGGIYSGLSYILAMNLNILAIIAVWVSGDTQGLLFLVSFWKHMAEKLLFLLKHST